MITTCATRKKNSKEKGAKKKKKKKTASKKLSLSSSLVNFCTMAINILKKKGKIIFFVNFFKILEPQNTEQ
jgi:hypothetical protein